MKSMLLLCSLAFLALAGCAPAAATADRIDWRAARSYVGESKTVCGVIVATGVSNPSEPNSFASLVFGDDPAEPLPTVQVRLDRLAATVLVLPAFDSAAFESPASYLHRRLCAHGLLETDSKGMTILQVRTPNELSPF